MSTTLLFVEILLIGLQSSVWIIFLVLILWGNEFLKLLEYVWLSDINIAMGLVIISFLYAIGIVIDRFADRIFEKWYSALKIQVFPGQKVPTQKMRFELAKSNPEVASNLYYARSRIRIARASALNFALITLFSLLYVVTKISVSSDKYILAFYILALGILLVVSTAWAWKTLSISFLHYLENYESGDVQLEQKSGKKNIMQKSGAQSKRAGYRLTAVSRGEPNEDQNKE